MVVGHQRSGDLVTVRLCGIDQALNVPGWIDDERLSALDVAEKVHEVRHLAGHRITRRHLASGQQLAKVEMLFDCVHWIPFFVRRTGGLQSSYSGGSSWISSAATRKGLLARTEPYRRPCSKSSVRISLRPLTSA